MKRNNFFLSFFPIFPISFLFILSFFFTSFFLLGVGGGGGGGCVKRMINFSLHFDVLN